jgi:hypothetical protein
MESERIAIEVVLVLAVAGLISALIPYLRRRLTIALKWDLDYQNAIRRIENDWRDEKQRYENRILELEKQVAFLLRALTTANNEIDALKKNTTAYRQITAPPARILLICGGDDRFCNADRQALRRAGVSFERLVNATKDSVRQELRRKREDGNPWKRIHISSHANDQGIALADGVADPDWWNETLNGVAGIVLAACQTMTVADAIAGLVPYVVAIREDINNQDASQFVFSFWRAVADGLSFPEAFERALSETPQVSEFAVLRTA